jgi:hypothetical protein
MSFQGGRNGLRGGSYMPAPTCFIQSTVTGECATRPVWSEPSTRGLVEMANGVGLVPGSVCGLNTRNAHIPCLGAYCSNAYSGICVQDNANYNPSVNLNYVRYGSRL